MDRLAKNAMLAKQAGLSYGKWKAMQPRVEFKKPEIPDGMKRCEYCGKPFEPKNAKRFCKDACRATAYRMRTGRW